MALDIKTKLILPLVLAGLCQSCATYKAPSSAYLPSTKDEYSSIRKNASEHSLYNAIPRHRAQIKAYDALHWTTWALFGNDDDGIFGENYSPPYSTNINFAAFSSWFARNPAHNFCFYAVGSAQWKKHHSFSVFRLGNMETALLSKDKPEVFSKESLGIKFNINDYKPFLSLHFPLPFSREFQSYAGWRGGGSLGFALRINKKKDKSNK